MSYVQFASIALLDTMNPSHSEAIDICAPVSDVCGNGIVINFSQKELENRILIQKKNVFSDKIMPMYIRLLITT